MAHMEATILDTNFNIVGIVDDYQSMIWTERYAEAGDFELYGAIGSTISKYCKLGYFVTIPESNRAMIIESIEFSQEVNESDKILVSGRSLEALLLRRIVWDQTILSGETYGKVQNAVKKLLTDNAIEPEDPNRAIPNLIFLDSTEEDITSLEFDSAQFTGNTLYDAVKQFADAFDIGFKIELFGTYLRFSLFAGKNRSFEQSTYNYVVYSSEYDNLLSSDFKQNITNFSNVALVAGEGEGSERRKIKYYYDFSEPSGMNRYELFVDARDISSTVDDGQGGSTQLTDQEYEYELANRGASKLAEVAEDYSFDAQIDTINSYQYGTDYFIGDILQLIDNMGNSGQFRITEFIRSMDSSGYSAYPQFKIISRMDSVIPVDLQGLPARIASLPDCAYDMPLKDLVVAIEPKQAGSGDPYPAGGGVNKWNEKYALGFWNANGVFSANTSGYMSSESHIPVKPSEDYYFVNGSNTSYYVCYYEQDKTFIRRDTLAANQHIITMPSNCYYINFSTFADYGTTYKHDISVNYPSTDTSYHPTANIRPISGWDSVKVSATGKNLYNIKNQTKTTINTFCAMYLPSNSDITFSTNIAQTGLYASYYDNGNWVSIAYIYNSRILSFNTGNHNYIRLMTYNEGTQATEFQAELGSTATTYEPYNGQTATIALPHTVYGSEHDVDSGVGDETWSDKIDLGSLNWTKWTNNYKGFYAGLNPQAKGVPATSLESGVCESLKPETYNKVVNGTVDCSFHIANTTHILYVYRSDLQSLSASDFKTAIAGTMLCYELNEPTTYQATPTEITTQYGLNNIFADTGDINKVIYFKNKWR